MRLAVIFATVPVRHMSVRAGAWAAETRDRHGQRPCESAEPGGQGQDYEASLMGSADVSQVSAQSCGGHPGILTQLPARNANGP